MFRPSLKYFPPFFFCAAFQSALAAVALWRVPAEGLSFARLILFGAIIFLFLSGIGLGFYSRRDSLRFERLLSTPIIFSSALLSLTFGISLFLLRYLAPERLLPYYERLSPLLGLLFFLALESAFFLLYLKNGFRLQALTERRDLFRAALLPFGAFLLLFLFVALTKIGVTPDTGYWGEPGVAIQGWHFILSLLIGISLLFFSAKNFAQKNPHFETRYLPFAIYLVAAALWLSVPLETLRGSFYAPASAPTNISLPYSDAGFYDYLAQSLLIGTKYVGGIPPRPLYVLFLAVLHFFFGQNYPAIINAQVLVLALFPVVLYFLAKRIHSPAAGVLVALFAVFREYTGLWIASNTRVANSKIFTTDLPTAFGVALICLVCLRMLERRDLRSTVVAGGAFGALLLLRTQSALTLPFLFLLILLAFNFNWRKWIQTGIIFTLALTLTVSPWLIHNRQISGKFSFDDPKQVAVIYSQYSLTGNLDLSQFDPETDSVRERIISFTLAHPAYVANFFAAHFLNTEIGGVLALPLIKPFNGLQKPVNLYWVDWNGSLECHNALLVLFYLFIAACGIGGAWRRLKWAGLIPLTFNVGYAVSNGIARFSSWRYNLPVDWVFYFYFAIGVVELFALAFSSFNIKVNLNAKAQNLEGAQERFSLRALAPLLIFIFVGAAPWLAEGFAAPRYASAQGELTQKFVAAGYAQNEVAAFLQQPNAILEEGRLLYPRMYWRGEGLASANPWPAYAAQNFSRIGFTLLNARFQHFAFPTDQLLNFPQGADAILLACKSDYGLPLVRVILFDGATYQNAPLDEPCP
ncbi:MAG: glycosyltransferase family 39 protein [Anaerolineales bacterium]|nr:glycosyltransferase family 39 protein [Anaerolineales bacterium]